MKRLLTGLMVISLLALPAATSMAQDNDLSLEAAAGIVEAAVAKAMEMDLKMNVALVDAGGNLKAFARMDGAWLGSIDIAIKKAKTARYFDMPSGDLGKLSQPGGPLYNIEVSNGGLITFPGGLPLTNADGTIIGAIGVSGSTVENDLTVAQAGAAAAGTTVASASNDEAAIMAVLNKLKQAIEGKDINLMMETFSDEFEHPMVGGKDEAKVMLEMGLEMGYADDGEVTFDDLEITFNDDGTAMAYPMDLSGPPGSVAVELTLKKEGNEWKIVTLDADV
jgi:uncharacterized protein GlcG (DUF336 family)/ketosteroid isomerase-like protein